MDIKVLGTEFYSFVQQIDDAFLLQQLYKFYLFLQDKAWNADNMKTYILRFMQNNAGCQKDKTKSTQYFIIKGALTKVASSPNAYQIVTSQLKKLFKHSQQSVNKLDELFRQDVFKHNSQCNDRKQEYIKLFLKYKEIRRLQLVLLVLVQKRQMEVRYDIKLLYNQLENQYVKQQIHIRDANEILINLYYKYAEYLLKERKRTFNDMKLRMTIYKNNLVNQLKLINQIQKKVEQ